FEHDALTRRIGQPLAHCRACFLPEKARAPPQEGGEINGPSHYEDVLVVRANQLTYKTVGAITPNEAKPSQTCPVCGERSRSRRIYRCPQCHPTGSRDVIGAVNILSLGQHDALLPSRTLPQQVKYLRPGAVVRADIPQVARLRPRSPGLSR